MADLPCALALARYVEANVVETEQAVEMLVPGAIMSAMALPPEHRTAFLVGEKSA